MLRPSIEKLTLCGYIIVLVSIQLPVDPNKPILYSIRSICMYKLF